MKVAVVTGSGKKRVGWHVARALGLRGYRLAIHYHRSAAEAQTAIGEFAAEGIEAHGFQADLGAEGGVAGLTEKVLAHFGRVDVLVNSASVWLRKRLEDTTVADVRSCFEINTLAPFVCAQRFGLAMAQQTEGGCIINIGDWAIARPYVDYAAYFLSKGAIPALTRVLAVELGVRNPRVRVNCIAPGPVMIPPDISEAERRQALEATLLKHEGSPENVAQAVLFLVDNEFVTGTCITVDGGRTVFAPDCVV
jgi:pteridine reductase